MSTSLKPFEELGTAWKYNEFFRARVQLTLLYTSILGVILFLFSSFLYVTTAQNFARDNDDEPEEHLAYHETFEELFLESFWEDLFTANIILLILSAFFGFFLAGRTLKPIERKVQQQVQFSQDVAHELRTPLSALYASVNATLRDTTLQKEYRDALTDVRSEAQRLIALAERLLSSTAHDGVDIKKEEVSVDEVLHTVIERLSALSKEKGLSFNTKSVERLVVRGNVEQLQDMFSNIIHNAIKFSRPQGSIDVLTSSTGMVSITDHGIGISKENIERVWDRFYTTNAARDERGVRGAGLGLAIVRDIAYAHNADVELKSNEGVGTTMTIRFTPVR